MYLISSVLFLLSLLRFTKESVSIISPLELLSKDLTSIPVKYSSYGEYPYDISLVGHIYYNNEDPYACSDLPELPKQNSTNGTLATFVLADRGSCSFATKTRKVENAGGKLMIIVNHEQDFDKIILLTDDGTGQDLTIPTILIPEEIGDSLKDYLNSNSGINNETKANVSTTPIILHYDNNIVNRTNEVKLRIFTDPMDERLYTLLNEINNSYPQLLTKLKFSPVYSFNTKENREYLDNKGRCMCKRKYCEEYNIFEGKGNNILVEAIRQKCVYSISEEEDKNLKQNLQAQRLYFNYMRKFYDECYTKHNITMLCSDQILFGFSPIYSDRVNRCFLNSFRTNNETFKEYDEIYKNCESNVILDESLFYLSTNTAMNALPLIYLNDNVFYGSWKTDNVIKAICSNLNEEQRPELCYTINSNKKTSIHMKHIHLLLMFIVILVGLNIIIYFCVKRYLNNKYLKQTSQSRLEHREKIKQNLNEEVFELANTDNSPKLYI